MKRLHNDKALWFFGLAAFACLAVSLPATLKAMELFHGSYGGIAATFVFEIGAVGAELATLAIPQWRKRLLLLTITLLILTTGGNYALGVDHFGGAALDSGTTYATIRAAGYGGLLAIMSSAIFPALLFVFLTAFTARFRMVRGGYDTPAGALAFWMSSYGQWLNTRVNTAEQLVSSLEQSMSTSEQQAILAHAAAERARADYEQRLTSAEQERERLFDEASQLAGRYDQTVKQLEQEARAIERQRDQAEQAVSTLQRDLAGRDQQVNELLEELNSRPAPMTVEVIKVARAQLTLDQAAELFGVSVSTVRRRLPQMDVIEQEH